MSIFSTPSCSFRSKLPACKISSRRDGFSAERAVLKAAFPAGFTLIELMVVIGIMMLLTAIIMFKSTSFNSAILLRNFAYEVGFSLHEAQVYGIAVKNSVSSSGNTFESLYGIYFDNSGGLLDNPQGKFTLFSDTNPTAGTDLDPTALGVYTVSTFQVQNGLYIHDFCAVGNGITHCASDPSSNGIKWLSIAFQRPNPNALITTNVETNPNLNYYSQAYIIVGSPNGTTRKITVWINGFIDVAPTSTSPTAS